MNRKTAALITSIVLILAIIGGGVAYYLHVVGTNESDATEPLEGYIDLSTLDDRYEDHARSWDDRTAPHKDQARATATKLASGSFSWPLPSDEESTDQDRLWEVQDRTLRDMVTGKAVLKVFMASKRNGIPQTEINPWSLDWQREIDDSHKLPSNAIPRGNGIWLKGRDISGDGKITADEVIVEEDWRYYAKGLCAWMDTAEIEGVTTETSVENYVHDYASFYEDRKIQKSDKEEEGEWFVLKFWDEKTGSVWLRLGFNMKDGRVAVLPTEAPKAPEKPAEKPKPKPADPKPSTTPPAEDPKPKPEDTNPKPKPEDTNPQPKPADNNPTPQKPDGEGGKQPETSSTQTGNADPRPRDDPGPGSQQSASDTTPPVQDVSQAVTTDGIHDSGFNSGHGPTGTDDKKSDADPDDAKQPVDAVVNDTPQNVETNLADKIDPTTGQPASENNDVIVPGGGTTDTNKEPEATGSAELDNDFGF